MNLRRRLLEALQGGPVTLEEAFALAGDWGFHGARGEARVMEALLELKLEGAVSSTGLYPQCRYALSPALQIDLEEGLPLRDPREVWRAMQAVLGVGSLEAERLPLQALIARLEGCPTALRARVELEFDLLVGQRMAAPGTGSRLLKLYPRLRRLFLEAVCLAAESELVIGR
jgi:hypothetical protein